MQTYGGQVSHLFIYLNSFTYSFKFTYFHIVHMDFKKEILVKKNKPLAAMKTTIKQKNLSQIYITERP